MTVTGAASVGVQPSADFGWEPETPQAAEAAATTPTARRRPFADSFHRAGSPVAGVHYVGGIEATAPSAPLSRLLSSMSHRVPIRDDVGRLTHEVNRVSAPFADTSPLSRIQRPLEKEVTGRAGSWQTAVAGALVGASAGLVTFSATLSGVELVAGVAVALGFLMTPLGLAAVLGPVSVVGAGLIVWGLVRARRQRMPQEDLKDLQAFMEEAKTLRAIAETLDSLKPSNDREVNQAVEALKERVATLADMAATFKAIDTKRSKRGPTYLLGWGALGAGVGWVVSYLSVLIVAAIAGAAKNNSRGSSSSTTHHHHYHGSNVFLWWWLFGGHGHCHRYHRGYCGSSRSGPASRWGAGQSRETVPARSLRPLEPPPPASLGGRPGAGHGRVPKRCALY